MAHPSVFVGQLVSWLVRSPLYHGTPFCLCRSVSQLVGQLTSILRRTYLSLSVSYSVCWSSHLCLTVYLSVFVSQLANWLVGQLTSVFRRTFLSLLVGRLAVLAVGITLCVCMSIHQVRFSSGQFLDTLGRRGDLREDSVEILFQSFFFA